MRLLTILCLVLLVSCSQEPEVVQEPEVFTGPFLVRDGVTYDQNTNEPVTGIIESVWESGRLGHRQNYTDGELNGISERFWATGQLFNRGNFIDGEIDGFWEGFYGNGLVV